MPYSIEKKKKYNREYGKLRTSRYRVRKYRDKLRMRTHGRAYVTDPPNDVTVPPENVTDPVDIEAVYDE